MTPRPDRPPRTSQALLGALVAHAVSSALTAASRSCHAAGWRLNRWQWRIDGIPDPTTRERAVGTGHPSTYRAPVVPMPPRGA